MKRLLPLALVPVVLATAIAADPAPAEDPWSGKTRDDVVTLLGKPNHTKTTRDGSVLTYKLLRLEEGAVPPKSVIVLSVPGVGMVARVQEGVSLHDPDVNIAPTEIDQRGRGTGGGLSENDSATLSWDTETGELTRSWEDKPAIRSKLTLRFEVDPEGGIRGWSVSPKKAAHP